MADTKWVRIECPGIDGTAVVARESLDHWRARGWTEAPPPPAPAPPAKAKAAPKPADDKKDEG